MNCPRVEIFLSLPEKVACPHFSALARSGPAFKGLTSIEKEGKL